MSGKFNSQKCRVCGNNCQVMHMGPTFQLDICVRCDRRDDVKTCVRCGRSDLVHGVTVNEFGLCPSCEEHEYDSAVMLALDEEWEDALAVRDEHGNVILLIRKLTP
jgi:hypothetical protein